jgi:SAM-dependent methyltransferase
MNLDRAIRYPLSPTAPALDRLLTALGVGCLGQCVVCGALTRFVDFTENLRESCVCARCQATNRHRQVAYVVCNAMQARLRRRVRSLAAVTRVSDLIVYNTEAGGPIHRTLRTLPGYRCSEYFGSHYQSGERVNGIVHQDLMHLAMEDASVDLVLSSDVFEHIPDPYTAHAEVHRVLRPNGRHVFTVPFHQMEFLDDVRAHIDDRGVLVLDKEAIYHHDPIRPSEGALVYTIFGLEMLVKLRRIGFLTNLYKLYSPLHGIFGPNAIVFEAVKAP